MAFINVLYNLWPNGDEKADGLRDGIAISAPTIFAKYGINSPLLVAHVMAQISHECGAGHDIVENLNYTAERMTQVWPSRFPTIGSAQPYAHNPKALANKVYNGRMGNRAGSDDGWNFRGRGGSQTTGREGYERVAKQTGFDVVNNPDILIDPKTFLECSVSDFINCGCLPFAKADDVVNVTRRLNGGTIGLQDRIEWLRRWKAALGGGPIDFSIPAAAEPLPPTVHKGSHGEYVKLLQSKLCVDPDGDFGPKTEAKLKAYQTAHNLVADGVAGPQTWKSLNSGE